MSERDQLAKEKVWQRLELVQRAMAYLQSKNVDSPRLCAEMLLAHTLGCRRLDLYTHFDTPVPDEARNNFRELIRRRAMRVPVQHLTGQTEFWSLPIACDARAFIPRPETELAVQATLDAIAGIDKPVIAEVGTGTGCISVALATEKPEAEIIASDISSDALALTAENLSRHQLATRVRLLHGDMVAPFIENGLRRHFDVVVSNPPYIAEGEKASLQPEVRDFDPHTALFSGHKGLDFTQRLLQDVPLILKPSGFLIFEIAEGRHDAISGMICASGWAEAKAIPDHAGILRVVVAQRVSDGLS